MLLFGGRRCILRHNAHQLVRYIRLFQIGNFLRREVEFDCLHCALDMMHFRGAYDRRSNLGQKPCKRNFGHRNASFFCQLCYSADDFIVLFSGGIVFEFRTATGNTKNIAKHIINITGADSFEIEAAIPYTVEDLDYTNSGCRANQEQSDKTFRPEIAGSIENMDDYDIVFLGYPIWWGEEPRIIDTFLESYDFSDKTLIPFCTSGSSSIAASERNITNLGVSIGNQLEGRRFAGTASEQGVAEWIDTLALLPEEEVEPKMQIAINGHTLTATLADNTSAQALVELLTAGPLTLELHDYANFEKVGTLPQMLPRNDEPIDTDYGDIILYQGNQFVLYYDTNSWTFTRLGHVDDITKEELQEILGDGNVTVTLSLVD